MLNQGDYAYAVGRIRANEPNLLGKQDYEQLISAPNKESVIRLLNDKGWFLPDNASADDAENILHSSWQLIRECVPDANFFHTFIVENDFSNLKAAIKAVFSGYDVYKYFSFPCIVDPSIIADAVTEKNFDYLPNFLQEPCRLAYTAIAEQNSGQAAETIIDKASLRYRAALAEKSGSPLLYKITAFHCAAADIKIALRCVLTAKSVDFLRTSLCDVKHFDKSDLIHSAVSVESIAAFIEKTALSFLSEPIKKGFTAFENACTDYTLRLIQSAAGEVYGPDPLVAFWVKRMYEVKYIRIILSAKENNLPAEEIRRKVRGTDV